MKWSEIIVLQNLYIYIYKIGFFPSSDKCQEAFTTCVIHVFFFLHFRFFFF